MYTFGIHHHPQIAQILFFMNELWSIFLNKIMLQCTYIHIFYSFVTKANAFKFLSFIWLCLISIFLHHLLLTLLCLILVILMLCINLILLVFKNGGKLFSYFSFVKIGI